MSFLYIFRFLLFEWCSKFSFFPPEKLSITITLLFSSNNLSTKWLPIKPAPPVTIDFIFYTPIFFNIILISIFIEFEIFCPFSFEYFV